MEGTDNLLTDPEMMKLTQDPDTKFDIVMTSIIPTSEVAYFLAHRFGAQLVLYCSAQNSMSQISHALGMPHNPSYSPFVMLGYNRKTLASSIIARTINTIVTILAEYGFRFVGMIKIASNRLASQRVALGKHHFLSCSAVCLVAIEMGG